MTTNPRTPRTTAPAVPRRSRRLGWVTVVLLVTLPAAFGRGGAASPFVGASLRADGLLVPDGMRAEVSAGDPLVLYPPIASVAGISLATLAGSVVMVGFHEASYDDALPLTPVGVLAENDNTTKFVPQPDDLSGLPYVVQASRGRAHSAVSAVDVLLEPGVAVNSPVDGVVTVVSDYDLYGQYPDTRVEIKPDGAPHLRVVLIHLDGVTVAPGDRVEAGRTQLAAAANRFGFESQIDRYARRGGLGHVHIEVKPPGGRPTD